jgi:hypothetical protein
MNTKEATLMDLMKRLTSKKKRIDIRLKGRPNLEYTTNPLINKRHGKSYCKNNFSGIGNA